MHRSSLLIEISFDQIKFTVAVRTGTVPYRIMEDFDRHLLIGLTGTGTLERDGWCEEKNVWYINTYEA